MFKIFLLLLNFGIFWHIMLTGGLLVITRWFSIAELLPWNLLLAEALETYLLQLQTLTTFLAILVLPGCVFAMWRLRELAR